MPDCRRGATSPPSCRASPPCWPSLRGTSAEALAETTTRNAVAALPRLGALLDGAVRRRLKKSGGDLAPGCHPAPSAARCSLGATQFARRDYNNSLELCYDIVFHPYRSRDPRARHRFHRFLGRGPDRDPRPRTLGADHGTPGRTDASGRTGRHGTRPADHGREGGRRRQARRCRHQAHRQEGRRRHQARRQEDRQRRLEHRLEGCRWRARRRPQDRRARSPVPPSTPPRPASNRPRADRRQGRDARRRIDPDAIDLGTTRFGGFFLVRSRARSGAPDRGSTMPVRLPAFLITHGSPSFESLSGPSAIRLAANAPRSARSRPRARIARGGPLMAPRAGRRCPKSTSPTTATSATCTWAPSGSRARCAGRARTRSSSSTCSA